MNIEPIDKQMPDEHQPKKHLDLLHIEAPNVSSVLSPDTKPLDMLAVVEPGQQSSLVSYRESKNLDPIDLTFDETFDEGEIHAKIYPAIKVKPMRRDGITLTAIYHLFSGCLLLLLTCLLVVPTLIFGAVTFIENAEAFIGVAIFGFMSITSMFLCLLNLVVGYGLWVQRQWARVAAIALAFVSLFGFPIFTIIGGLTLWYMLQPQVADEFTR